MKKKQPPLPPINLAQKNVPNSSNILKGDILWRMGDTPLPRAVVEEMQRLRGRRE